MYKIHIEGAPFERGRMHGRLLRDPIRSHLAAWKNAVRSTYGIEAEQLVQRVLSETDYVSAIKRWAPDLLGEMHGIADGAGVDADAIYTLNLLDECWARYGKAGLPREHCSSIGYRGDTASPSIVAQNMDIEAFR